MIQRDLDARKLPPLFEAGATAEGWTRRRREMLDLLARGEYGFPPPPPAWVRAETKREEPRALGGKAVHRELGLTVPAPRGEFSFPVDLVLPIADRKAPLVVYISFTRYPGGFLPVEEIVDSGHAMAVFCYTDVSEDRDDGFSSSLAGLYDRSGDDGTQWGKISLWAWAASRVLDHALTLDGIDKDRVFCAGYSRLGKTALWCGALDERFAGVASGGSGCSGAAITRDKKGESAQAISSRFPHWFCGNYGKYAGREHEMPFDQHMLLAAMAPRPLYLAFASEDEWADPYSEFLSCVEADKAYRLLGKTGFVHADRFLEPGESLHEGDIGCHLRPGTHFFSRYDWRRILGFMDRRLPGGPRLLLRKADGKELPGLRDFLLEIGAGENGFGGTAFGRGEGTLEETLTAFADMAAGRNIPKGRVRQIVYWLLDDQGGVLGMSKLRPQLTEELLHHGGNIGYYVRPSARGKGCGRRLLELTLEEARKAGLHRVLITMDADNAASIGTAESCGGRREDTRVDDKGRAFHRYWIDLDGRA